MSRDVSPDFRRIRVFLTNPHPCSYLPGNEATTAFVAAADPNLEVISHIEITSRLYSQLSDMGFRRSGQYFYSPRCKSCDACISARVVVSSFKNSKQQKRCLKRQFIVIILQILFIKKEAWVNFLSYLRYIWRRN